MSNELSNRLPVCTLFGAGTADAVVTGVCHRNLASRHSGRANIKFKNETHFKSLKILSFLAKMIACAASRRTSSPYEQVRLSR